MTTLPLPMVVHVIEPDPTMRIVLFDIGDRFREAWDRGTPPTAKEAQSPMVPDPIWIDCEGSGYPPNTTFNGGTFGMCAMCGSLLSLSGGKVVAHQRRDVLAMIDRGDFG